MAEHTLVEQLQSLALNHKSNLADVLRTALVISTKLKLTDLQKWVREELNGYEDEVPSYRIIPCQLKAYNPYHGWQPMVFESIDESGLFSKINVVSSVGEIQKLLENAPEGETALQSPLSDQIVNQLNDASDGIRTAITRFISVSAMYGILDKVRTNLLEWSLQLEQEGITGHKMSFSDEEVETASHITYNIYNSNVGVLGNASNNTITQEIISGDVQSLKSYLKKSLGIDDELTYELEDAIKSDGKPSEVGKFGDHIQAWIAKVINQANDKLISLSVSETSNIVVQALKHFFDN